MLVLQYMEIDGESFVAHLTWVCMRETKANKQTYRNEAEGKES